MGFDNWGGGPNPFTFEDIDGSTVAIGATDDRES